MKVFPLVFANKRSILYQLNKLVVNSQILIGIDSMTVSFFRGLALKDAIFKPSYAYEEANLVRILF